MPKHVARATERIRHAVLLDTYAQWCRDRGAVQAPTDALSTLLYQALNKSLVHQCMRVIKVPVSVLLGMCVQRNWRAFCTAHNVDNKSFEEVSEIDVSRLILLRSKLGV
jgi:hypothetical protein